MPILRLVFVLPCYNLDDFPEALQDDLATDLLACWTSLWHPALIALVQGLPEWKRADSSSLDIQNALVICPQVAVEKLDLPLRERLELNGSVLVEGQGSREKTLAALFEALHNKLDSDSPSLSMDESTIQPLGCDDFFAFGYAFLQVHLLTKKLRYSGNLDQPLLAEQCLEAARAALKNDSVEFEKWIQSAFDQLSQERDHYYSQSVNLLDICLLAPSTLGARLTDQLKQDHAFSIISSAKNLAALKRQHPTNWQSLLKSLQSGNKSIIGGLDSESAWRFMDANAIRRDLVRGRAAYQDLGITAPKVFSRFTLGLSSDSSMHLCNAGYDAAILYGWQQGGYPSSSQAKVIWEASDGSSVDAIAAFIVDASSPSSFLAMGTKIGEQLDYHQAPTLVFAHWPHQVHPYFFDLMRAIARTPALGKWTQVEDYFENTQRPYSGERFPNTKFPIAWPPSPWLADFVRAADLAQQADTCHHSQVLLQQVGSSLNPPVRESKDAEMPTSDDALQGNNANPDEPTSNEINSDSVGTYRDPKMVQLMSQCDQLFDQFVQGQPPGSMPEQPSKIGETIDQALRNMTQKTLQQWQQILPREPGATVSQGTLLFNPSSSPSRFKIQGLSGEYDTSADSRIYACAFQNGQSDLVVDVPPMGIVRLAPHSGPVRRVANPMIANQQGVLGNEFLEVHIDAQQGHLKSFYVPHRRGNRLSGMLALRSSRDSVYSECRVDRFEVLRSNSVVGIIEVAGRLWVQSKAVATFTLRYTLWKGSRWIDIEVELDQVEYLSQSIDKDYVAWRTAWPSESAILHHWQQGTKTTMAGRKIFAPTLVEVDEVEHRCYLFSQQIPLHYRIQDRFLDSIIATPVEPRTHAKFALGIDLPRPFQTAIQWNQPQWICPDHASDLSFGKSAWFFQCSSPNVHIEAYDSLLDRQGNLVGMRILLHESQNKSCNIQVQSFRKVVRANRTNLLGKNLGALKIQDSLVAIPLRANEQSFVDLWWS